MSMRISTGPRDYSKPWTQTYTGRAFFHWDPRPEDVCIEDIAWQLSWEPRFAGATKRRLCVGQHSVLVSRLCPPEDALWGLLHDASEAYIKDLPTPIKTHKRMAPYRAAERRIMWVVCRAFGLPPKQPISVKIADRVMLVTEARDFMSPRHPEWSSKVGDIEPLPDRLDSWSQEDAYSRFLERFHELQKKAD